ncbi:Bud site selection protein 22 [Nakaseomyces bracarensis]|uniref:Bud site selection protein 22 n=1 Tax=Nakaseomyces bracarensis TaxID=273131 RepID=A0ABR4NXZ8_9SACH
MSKENLLFKLDGYEYQWHYLQGTQDNFQPRFNLTQRYYNAKGRKNSKKITKILATLNKENLIENLRNTRIEILNRKLHNIEKHVSNYIYKTIKSFVNNDISKFQEVIQSIQKKLGQEDEGLKEFSTLVMKSKIIKLVITKLQKSSHNLVQAKEEVSDKRIPKWAEDHEYVTIWKNKDHKFNPSNVWNTNVMAIKGADVMVSRIMNGKKYKELIDKFDDSIDTFLNINREKKLEKQKLQKKDKQPVGKDEQDSTPIQGDVEEDDYSDSGIEDNIEYDENMDEETLLKQYDNMLVDSESEGDDEDSELSDNENVNISLAQKKEKKSKDARGELPELMVGYISGGSDDEIEDDKIAKEQIDIKPVKKNRRGQRARRKIWEQKYGSKAKHVQRELEKEREKRQKRQEEYEERVAKRAARSEQQKEYLEKKFEEKREKEINRKRVAETEDHPSWIAKKMAEEKRKKAKFEGKKVVFD